MKLYFAPTSPFVRKTLIVCHECGLAGSVEIVETAVAPATDNPTLSAVNPLKMIPTLETDDGDVLMDSLVICDYLIARSGKQSLLPNDPARRTEILRNHALISGLTDRAVATRYENSLRPEEYRWPAMMEDNKTRIMTGLKWLDRKADDFEGDLTLASAALVAFGRYLDLRFDDWSWRAKAPALASTFEGLNNQPSVQKAYS